MRQAPCGFAYIMHVIISVLDACIYFSLKCTIKIGNSDERLRLSSTQLYEYIVYVRDAFTDTISDHLE